MIDAVKTALRIKTTAYDSELVELIAAALLDLGVAGVNGAGSMTLMTPKGADALVRRAVVTYCKMNFGLPEDYDKLKKSYDEQKAQLATCTGYTSWPVEG